MEVEIIIQLVLHKESTVHSIKYIFLLCDNTLDWMGKTRWIRISENQL